MVQMLCLFICENRKKGFHCEMFVIHNEMTVVILRSRSWDTHQQDHALDLYHP